MADIGSEGRLLSLGESDTETLVRRNKANRELMVTTIQSSHLSFHSFLDHELYVRSLKGSHTHSVMQH